MSRTCSVFCAGVVFALAMFPASARVDSYLVGDPRLSFGSIELDVPDDWSSLRQEPGSPSGQALKLAPPGDKPFLLLITALPLLERAGPNGRCADLRPIADDVRDKLREVAEERDVPLQELRGSRTCGYYASVTDRTVETPSLKNFKYGTQGYAVTGHAMLSFTVLTNLKDPPELSTALEIVGSARHIGLPDSSKSAMAALRLSFPGKTWGLRVDLDGFKLRSTGPPKGRPGMHVAAGKDDPDINISIFLETDSRADSAKGYRQWYRDNHVRPIMGSKPFDIQESDRNGVPILEYSHTLADHNATMRHMNAFFVHDGVWIDVHISKVPYSPDDREHFNAIFDSVVIEWKRGAEI